MLAVGENPVWGTEVGAGWLETRSTAVVGRGVVPGSEELGGSLASGGGQT